jgi:hypothetical protein
VPFPSPYARTKLNVPLWGGGNRGKKKKKKKKKPKKKRRGKTYLTGTN